jgi:hypothetical protein
MTSELEERFLELGKNYNVQGCLLLTAEGAVIKTNLVTTKQLEIFFLLNVVFVKKK